MKQFLNPKRILLGFLCALVGAALMLVLLVRVAGGRTAFEHGLKFAQIYSVIEAHYVGDEDVNEAADAAYSAFVRAAGDEWSYYMNPEAYARYKDYSANRFVGIGITVNQDESGFHVQSVKADSPAMEAGILAGDVILSVDGQSTADMAMNQLQSAIAAKLDQAFEMVLSRDGKEVTVTVTSRVIEVDPVSWCILEGGTAYIGIANFESGAADKVLRALEAARARGIGGVIFDVRGNPGGRLDELMKLLDPLLPQGNMFISVSADGERTEYPSDGARLDLPAAVLMDGGSYSAAEYFAAAMSEYGVAFTVGEPTTGKGRAQVNFELGDGSAVHISVDRYLTPKERALAELGGIEPDIFSQMDAENRIRVTDGRGEYGADIQLIAALDALGRG